jgi:hypothetical protein
VPEGTVVPLATALTTRLGGVLVGPVVAIVPALVGRALSALAPEPGTAGRSSHRGVPAGPGTGRSPRGRAAIPPRAGPPRATASPGSRRPTARPRSTAPHGHRRDSGDQPPSGGADRPRLVARRRAPARVREPAPGRRVRPAGHGGLRGRARRRQRPRPDEPPLRRVDTALVRVPGVSHDIAARPSQLIAKVAHVLARGADVAVGTGITPTEVGRPRFSRGAKMAVVPSSSRTDDTHGTQWPNEPPAASPPRRRDVRAGRSDTAGSSRASGGRGDFPTGHRWPAAQDERGARSDGAARAEKAKKAS